MHAPEPTINTVKRNVIRFSGKDPTAGVRKGYLRSVLPMSLLSLAECLINTHQRVLRFSTAFH